LRELLYDVDMRQNRGFLHAARLPSVQEISQLLDHLCVKRKDKNSDKSQRCPVTVLRI